MDKQTQKNLLDLVKRNYQEIATHYSETRKKKLWPELFELARQVKDNDRVLDLGCGSGKLLQALQDKNIDYLGIDNCEDLIAEAKKSMPDGSEKFKFAVGDILDLSAIENNSFDYIFCIAVLQHIPGEDLRLQTLVQMKDKIKPTGKIIISVWNMRSNAWTKKNFCWLIFKFNLLKLIKKNKMDFGDILFDWKNSQGEKISQRYYHAFTKYELKRLGKKAGLKIEKIYKDEFNLYLTLKKNDI